MARQIDLISFEEDLKVFALSEISMAGNPRLSMNLLNASKNESAFKERVSSKWIARVDVQVNKQIYTLEVTAGFLGS